MTDDAMLAHLAGYAAITVVLSTADWAGLVGPLVGLTFVAAVAFVLAREGFRRLTATVRAEAEREARSAVAATDGGVEDGGER